MSFSAGVLGASGATGAELLRLLEAHPEAELAWASSRSQAGSPIRRVHPNLPDVELAFSEPQELPALAVLFCATPHGTTGPRAEELAHVAGLVVDLSSDFRLDDPDAYEATYGEQHPAPERLTAAAYGLPELEDPRLGKAGWIAGPGCLATASQLALLPLIEADLLAEGPVTIDAKVGSSAAGTGGGRWSSHAARSATVRPYAPAGHRHEAEIRANLLGDERPLWMSAHAVDMPRGVLATVHAPTDAGARQLHRALQTTYRDAPFVEVLSGRARPGGVPEPRFVAGTNRAQVALVSREDGGVVALCAIDNLGKGAAGSAVQSMNLARGLPETTGLEAQAAFP